MNAPETPEGYMKNAQGHLVPVSMIKEQDLLRDQTVGDLVKTAIDLNRQLAEFKASAFDDVDDLITICSERYNTKVGGKKGNVSLLSFDGNYKITRTYQNRVVFTEEIEVAREIFFNCLSKWTVDANPLASALINQAFKTNKQGQLSTSKLVEIMNYEIDDDEFKRGVNALKDAMKSLGSAVYLRAYRRVEKTEQWEPINLDISKL